MDKSLKKIYFAYNVRKLNLKQKTILINHLIINTKPYHLKKIEPKIYKMFQGLDFLKEDLNKNELAELIILIMSTEIKEPKRIEQLGGYMAGLSDVIEEQKRGAIKCN